MTFSFECSSRFANRHHPDNPPLPGTTIAAVSSSHYTGQSEHCTIDQPCQSEGGPMQGHSPFLRHWTIPTQSVLDRETFMRQRGPGGFVAASKPETSLPMLSKNTNNFSWFFSGMSRGCFGSPAPAVDTARLTSMPPACRLPSASLAPAVEAGDGQGAPHLQRKKQPNLVEFFFGNFGGSRSEFWTRPVHLLLRLLLPQNSRKKSRLNLVDFQLAIWAGPTAFVGPGLFACC